MTYLLAMAMLAGLGGTLAAGLLVAERLLQNYGPCTIHLNSEAPFTLAGGENLLEALYQRRIFIPSACGGQGTCGYCKVRVLEGGGAVLPTERPFLSETEIAEGTRLACQVKVKRDLRVEIREEYLRVQEFTARVAATRDLTHDIRELALELIEPAEMHFRPGQYVQVAVPTRRGCEFRAYSIASGPEQTRQIELAVRLVPGGLGSTYLHGLSVGETLRLTGPYGTFRLDESPGTQIVCIGGGCGLAPMRSIIETLYRRWPDRECWLFFGARTSRDTFWHEQFEQLAVAYPNFRFCFTISEPGAHDEAWTGPTGHVHEAVEIMLDTNPDRQAFICGPEPMVQAATDVLQRKGVQDNRIFRDTF